MDASASEREEGEISDDYEIISDESIDSLTGKKTGKSNSPAQELIRTISLSSVSDNYSGGEGKRITTSRRTTSKKCPRGHVHGKKRVCRKALEKRRSSYPKPKRKRYSDYNDSDSDSEILNKTIKQQLKEAVKLVDKKSEDNCTNNLQTRLKRMINPNYSVNKPTIHEDDEEVLALRDIALLSTQKTEEEEIVNKSPVTDEKANTSTDQELTELRIIALKSAFLKKHQNRKQKKETVDVPSAETVENEINTTVEEVVVAIEPIIPIPLAVEETVMENEVIISNTCSLIPVEEEKKPSIEEDPIEIVQETKEIVAETILQQNVEEKDDNCEGKDDNCEGKDDNCEGNEENIEEDEDIMRAMLLASMSKKITSEPTNISSKILKDTVNSVNNKVKNKLVTILPKAPMKKIIININAESDSDNESQTKSTPPENKIKTDENFNKNLSMLLKQARENVERNDNNDSTLDKSIVKMLPRSQQAEYKQLKQKLQVLKARRRTATQKIKRSLQKTDDAAKDLVKRNALTLKKVNKPRIFATKLKVNNFLKNKQLIIAAAAANKTATSSPDPVVRSAPQERSNPERNRYEGLEPLMRQIDEVRKKRDEEQATVQNLLSQLKVARNHLSSVHQHFTSLIQKLVAAKADIDKWLVSYP